MATADERMAIIETTLRALVDEHTRIRNRVHDLESLTGAVSLVGERQKILGEDISDVRVELRAMKRAFYTFAFSVIASALVFAFTAFGLH